MTMESSGDHLSEGMASGADFDGDGLEDLAVGAPDASIGGSEKTGRIYVIFGGSI